MSWGFDTDPEFQSVLDWAAEFVDKKVAPLDLVLNDFVATALTTNSIKILSDGSPWRPLIDVEDMSRALYWSCFRDTCFRN